MIRKSDVKKPKDMGKARDIKPKKPRKASADKDQYKVDITCITHIGRGGRPRKFASSTDLAKAMQRYFNACWRPMVDMYGRFVRDENGKMVFVQFKPYTVSGLALALNMSRETLLQYQKEAEFAAIVERAKMFVHVYTEEQLIVGKNADGAKFSLKNNFGWADKSEVKNEVAISEEDLALVAKVSGILADKENKDGG